MFVSHCNELDIQTCGSTVEAVLRGTLDMIRAYFSAAQKVGTYRSTLEALRVQPPRDPRELRIETDFSVHQELSL